MTRFKKLLAVVGATALLAFAAPAAYAGSGTEGYGGSNVVAGLEQTSRGGHRTQHGDRVDVGRLDGERVTAIATLDHRWVTERPAQHGDLRLQRVAPSAAPAR